MSEKAYGVNDYGHRAFILASDADMYSYLVDDPSAENTVKYPASADVGDGRGVILVDGVAGQAYSLVQAGNVLVRKATGAIAKGDPLTTSATPGALRKALPGERIHAVAVEAALSGDAYVAISLVSGCGVLTVPRTIVESVTGVDEDMKLLTISAGYRLDALVAKNDTANAVTIKVGKTAGTQTIVVPVAVAASDIKDLSLVLQTFSLTADQDVYIASTDWNSASLTIKAVQTYLL